VEVLIVAEVEVVLATVVEVEVASATVVEVEVALVIVEEVVVVIVEEGLQEEEVVVVVSVQNLNLQNMPLKPTDFLVYSLLEDVCSIVKFLLFLDFHFSVTYCCRK
jgi:hypothetical protein